MAYANRGRAPRTLTRDEQRALLRVSGEHARGFRDHVIFATALATGLREHELVALDIGDVVNSRGAPRRRVALRVYKGCENPSPNGPPQEVFVPDALAKKWRRFLSWKRRRKESLAGSAPLFVARGGQRLSERRLREAFAIWRDRADVSPSLSFHALRHTFCQRIYEKTHDLRLLQRLARHSLIETSQIYTEPSADDMMRAVENWDV